MGFRSSLKKLMGRKERREESSEPVKEAFGDKEVEPNKAGQRTFPSYRYMQELKLELKKRGSATSSSAEAVKPMGGVSEDGGASQKPSQEPDQEANQEEETKEGEDAAAAVLEADTEGEKEDEEDESKKSTEESDDMSSDEGSSSDGSDSDEEVKEDKKAKKKEEKTKVATKGEIEESVGKEPEEKPEEKPEEEEDKEKDQPEEKPKEDKKKSRRFFPFSFIRRKKKEPKKESEFTIKKESSMSKFFGGVKKVAGFMGDVAGAALKYNPFTIGGIQAKGVIDALTGKKKTDLYKMGELKDYYDNMIFFKTSVSKELWNNTAIEVEKRAREKIASEYGVSEVVMIPGGVLEDKTPLRERIQIIYNREVLNCLPIADESTEKALEREEANKKQQTTSGQEEAASESDQDSAEEEATKKEDDDPTSKSFSLPDLVTKLTGKAYNEAAAIWRKNRTGGGSSNETIFDKFGGTMNYVANMDYRALILKEWSLHGALAKRLDSFYGVEEKSLKDTSFKGQLCQDVDTEGYLYYQNAKPSLIRKIKKEMMLDKGSANKINEAKSVDDNNKSGEYSDAETQKMVGEILVKRQLACELGVQKDFGFSYASLSDEEKGKINRAYEGLKSLDPSVYHTTRSNIKSEVKQVIDQGRENLNIKPLIEDYFAIVEDDKEISKNLSRLKLLAEDIKGALDMGRPERIDGLMKEEGIDGTNEIVAGQFKLAFGNVLLIFSMAEAFAKKLSNSKGFGTYGKEVMEKLNPNKSNGKAEKNEVKVGDDVLSGRIILPTKDGKVSREKYLELFKDNSSSSSSRYGSSNDKERGANPRILERVVNDFVEKGLKSYLVKGDDINNWLGKHSNDLEMGTVITALEERKLISFEESNYEGILMQEEGKKKFEELKAKILEYGKSHTAKSSGIKGGYNEEDVTNHKTVVEKGILKESLGSKDQTTYLYLLKNDFKIDTTELPTTMKYLGSDQKVEIVLQKEESPKRGISDTPEYNEEDSQLTTDDSAQNQDGAQGDNGDGTENDKVDEGKASEMKDGVEKEGNEFFGSLGRGSANNYIKATFNYFDKVIGKTLKINEVTIKNILAYKIISSTDIINDDGQIDHNTGEFKHSYLETILGSRDNVINFVDEHKGDNNENLINGLEGGYSNLNLLDLLNYVKGLVTGK